MKKVSGFFNKIGAWFVNHAPSKRHIIQLYAALLYNANIKGFIKGEIYTGNSKFACVPGMNCYSCPGAVGSCPLGSLQNALNSANKTTPYYVLGILALFGVIFGRTICGYLCPVGMAQDFLYKIKTKKIKKNRTTRILSYLKYVFLILFVILIPILMGMFNMPDPAFCKYICPVGTFEGGFGLISHPNNANLYGMLGNLFSWKTLLLIIIVSFSVFYYRFYCRVICPLGLIYGFFNRFCIIGVKVNSSKCNDCGMCVAACKMDIKHVGDIECINCGECIKVCPQKAITWKGSKFLLHENQTNFVPREEKLDLVSSLPKVEETKVDVIAQVKDEKITAIPEQNEKIINVTQKKYIVIRKHKKDDEISTNSFNSKEVTIKDQELVKKLVKQNDKKVKKNNKFAAKPQRIYKNLDVKPISQEERKTPLYDKKKLKIFNICLFSFLTAVLAASLLYFNVFADMEPASPSTSTDPTTSEPSEPSEPEEFGRGVKAPSFELMNFNDENNPYIFDNTVNDGKVLVINFWATWCTSCVEELPHFDEVLKEKSDIVDIIAIHEYTNDLEYTKEFIDDKFEGFDIPMLRDNEGDAVFKALTGTSILPMTVILSPNNICTEIAFGSMNKELLIREIDFAFQYDQSL